MAPVVMNDEGSTEVDDVLDTAVETLRPRPFRHQRRLVCQAPVIVLSMD